ncbi:hypothetical protein [Mycolicibacterium sp. lyk4-40-TYG-92]|uniref:hypothetical protein n=1 Tax=Mycolicibacterium sp. lyk4-40-TYG-92 TaxID=3040295 RepID=UPI0025510714|nr:hypothetical protein [Mycolicibacterium sp. lyk4-40-TYG-92]
MTVGRDMRIRGLFAVLVLLLSTLLLALPSSAIAYADAAACPAQVAALDANQAKIAAHNQLLPPSGVAPPEVAGPVNREADQLNAEKDGLLASLARCEAVVDRLRDNGPAPKPLSEKNSQAMARATAAARPRWQNPTPPAKMSDGRVTIPRNHPLRPLWDIVKKLQNPMADYPLVPLQGEQPPKPDAKHASGYGVGTRVVKGENVPAISPDHIVPKVEILYLPRFLELTPENQWEVLNAPINLQWLPSEVNAQNKNSKSAEDMKGVDSDWQQEQIALQDRKRKELTDLIAQLADSQVR